MASTSTEGFRQDVLPAADLEKLQVKLAGHPDAWLLLGCPGTDGTLFHNDTSLCQVML